MSSSKNDETIVHVPANIAKMPLGFVIDAGGLVMKLIYRSKEDYTNCKPRTGLDSAVGKLRLRVFRLGDDTELLEFIQKNCDVMESCRQDLSRVWLQTGLNTVFFKTKMEDMFEIKSQMQSEFQALAKCYQLLFCYNLIPEFTKFLPPSIATIRTSLEYARTLFGLLTELLAAGDDAFYKTKPNNSIEKEIKKLLTIEPEVWLEELGHQRLEFPCLVANIGSGTSGGVMHKDGSFVPCYTDPIAGKSFHALAEALTGAKDFTELMEMAGRGDPTRVDIMGRDIKATNVDSDWYSIIPETITAFRLGKLTKNNTFQAGNHTKDDLAAAILHYHCQMFTNTALLHARIHQTKSIVFTGSFVAHPTIRDAMFQSFLQNWMAQLVHGVDLQVSAHFLPNSGFVCALGVWLLNMESTILTNES